MSINQIIIFLIPILILFSFIIILKFNNKTEYLLHPATFYSFIWFLLVLIPLIAFPNKIKSPLGIYWILFTTIVFSSGAILTTSQKSAKEKKRKEKKISEKLLKKIRIVTLVSILIGITSASIVLFYQSEFISSPISLSSYGEITRTLSLLRYYAGYVPPPISQILLFAVYLSPLLAGILTSIKKTKKDIILIVLSILPAILIFLLHTTRYPIIASITLLFSSYFSFNLYLNKKIKIISKKTIILGLSILIFLILILTFTLSLRIGNSVPAEYISYQIQTEKATIFGYLPAFSDWFEKFYSEKIPPSFGAYSFSGIFDILNIKERIPGLYLDYIQIGNDRTNIFTAHRGLIQDFTLAGSLIFIFLIGLITGHSYSKILRGNIIFLPLLTIFYSFTILSFIVSILNYNSIILALVIYSLIILSIPQKNEK